MRTSTVKIYPVLSTETVQDYTKSTERNERERIQQNHADLIYRRNNGRMRRYHGWNGRNS